MNKQDLINMPCDIGDTVCAFMRVNDKVKVISSTIKSMTLNQKGIKIDFKDKFYSGYLEDSIWFKTFEEMQKDKYVCLDETYYLCTLEQAEEKLKGLDKNNEWH